MNLWLITTGSSDVQIKDAKDWNEWHPKIKRSLYGIDHGRFKPADDDEAPYRIAARVLGLVDEKGEVNPDQLEFPLLKEFERQLKAESTAIDQIILLVSDQSEVFDEDERSSYTCPYWQDTCLLYPILEAHLQAKFPTAKITPLLLKPSADQAGLDSWNEVLTLVRQKIGELAIEPDLETVYVSHQAGTPAISSAVQFVSLARFGDRVKFLVSNEHQPEQTNVIESSSYLRGIQIEQAKKLLDRHDYYGVERLLRDDLQTCSAPVCKKVKVLLEIAIQWNFAKFEDFANGLTKNHGLELSKEAQTCLNDRNRYWWISYEAAYLGAIRLEQGNTVEALFHSFRSIEGLISMWAEWRYPEHISYSSNGSPELKISILDAIPDFLSDSKQKKMKLELTEKNKLGLYSFPLYELLRCTKTNWRSNSHIATVWKTAAPKRNDLFHRLRGLYEMDVFSAWDTQNSQEWEARILGCLNFVSGNDFASLQNASLMAKVHEQLKEAIAQL